MKTTIIILIFTFQLAIGQTRIYKEVTPKLLYRKENSGTVTLDESFQFSGLVYTFGYVKQQGQINGIKITVQNKTKKIIYNTIVKNNGGYYRVIFYKTENITDGCLFILNTADGTNENSFGSLVYSIKGEKIKQIGLLDVGFFGPTTLNTVLPINSYTIIKTDGKVINFDFKIDSLLYKIDYTKKLKLIKGSSISYVYKDNKLTAIKK